MSKSLRLHSPAVSAILVAVMVAMVGAAFYLVISAVFSFEHQADSREKGSVDRVFETHKSIILSEVERYSASNSAYLNVETNYDGDWVAQRFGQDMAGDYPHDAILLTRDGTIPAFVNSNGKMRSVDLLAGLAESNLQSLLQEIQRTYLTKLAVTDAGILEFIGRPRDVSGVTVEKIGDQVALVAASAIIPDPGGIPVKREAPHVVLVVHLMDDLHMRSMVKSLALNQIEVVDEIPEGYLGTPILSRGGQRVAYFAWQPVSRASTVVLSHAVLLGGAISLILAAILFILYQNFKTSNQLRAREREALHSAHHDTLTGFCRRARFSELVEARLEPCKAEQGLATLAYIDLDLLKEINDQHGHVFGDKVLSQMATRLGAFLRPTDIVGRIGGDEFLVWLDRRASTEDVQADIAQICENLNQPMDIEGIRMKVGCSIGVSAQPVSEVTTLSDITRQADLALQRCKSEGRRQFRFYDPNMDKALEERRFIRNGLKRALERDEFELFYQPIVSAQGSRMVFMEALIRWRHPVRGLMPPALFLTVAEEEGMMTEIGDWVLERAVADMSKRPGVGVSVNVCPAQLLDEDFAMKVENVLQKYDFPHDRLILEITESMMMDRSEEIRTLFVGLAESGVAVAIDDFGTGFSSLSSLHEYQFQKLKIDRSFVARIGMDREADTIIRTMIGLAKVLGMSVVAEGVETEEQRAFLVRSQCDFLQGYFFGKPEPLPRDDLNCRAIA